MQKNRLMVALLAGVLLLLLLPAVVFAALYEQAASSETNACFNLVNSSAGPNACLGETSSSGWPAGDLFIATNGSDVPNLDVIAHGLPGSCDTGGDWNDCLSDAYVKLPAGTCFRAYTDANYGGQRVFAASNRAADPGTQTYFFHFATPPSHLVNTISSIRLYAC